MDIRKIFELENDLAFQQLNSNVNSFNALKILKLENYEIRHSNILAWLLDPKENHGLRDTFMRKFLEYLILNEENNAHPHLENVISLLNHSLMESHVYREVRTHNNRYIDLVIMNQQQKFVIIIENKFYSSESKNQLDDYLSFIEQSVSDFNIIPIYLTLNGETPSNAQYFTLSYEQIEQILFSILTLFKEQLGHNAYSFIEDYHGILREKYYPNQEQIVQAIDIYRNHGETIDWLFEEMSKLSKPLSFEAGYPYEFKMKYKDSIAYIYNHGQNILSYSFEQFIQQHFDGAVESNSHPTTPRLLPPEWENIKNYRLKNPKYGVGKGLVVWFQKTPDQRLLLKAEIGPIESHERLTLLTNFERNGLVIKQSSKSESATYTSVFTKKLDIQKWNDISEIAQAMSALYNDPQFVIVREKIAHALNNQVYVEEAILQTNECTDTKEIIKCSFEKWMQQLQISTSHYRISTNNLSFKIPLFDQFKELLGETREKWWWDNGPFLFWFDLKKDSLYFTLEVGPIEANKRVELLEAIQRKGITFNRKGLNETSKYTRLFSKTISIEKTNEADLIKMFEDIYQDQALLSILEKLEVIYSELNREQ